MKIVEKLLKEENFNYPNPMDMIAELAFKVGYRHATLEILKWAEELKTKNTQDGFPHIVTIREVLDVLNREVEDVE